MSVREITFASAGIINAGELSTLFMGNGEGMPLDVINNGTVMHYVGIGWIKVRQATEEDYRLYPVVVADDHK